MDVFEEIYKKKEFDDQGIDYEFDITDGVMKVMVKDPEPTLLENIGEGLERVAGTTASMAVGALGATAGFTTDLASLFVSIGESVGAEDGKKLETFANTFETLSKENYGSQFYKGYFDNFIDDLKISDQKKKDFKAGFVAGEFLGVGNIGGQAAKKAPAVAKSIKGTSEEVGEAAQKRVDERTGLPLNSDGTVTVYHHTNKRAAESIRESGELRSAGEPDVYVTTQDTPDTGYGDTAVPIRIDPSKLSLDDMFPNGRKDFSLNIGKPGGSIPVDVIDPKLAPNKGEAVNLKPKVDRLNFYSKAEEVTNQLKQNKGTGQQYRQQLLKAGVKPDEIEWLGLDDVLNKGKITKQELQDQINANRIELDEVELSGGDLVLSSGEGLSTRFTENKTVMSAEDAYGPEYLNNRADEIFEEESIMDQDKVSVGKDSLYYQDGSRKYTIDDAYEQAKNKYDENPVMKYVDPKTQYIITGNDDVGYQIFRSEADSSNFRNAVRYNERYPSQSRDVTYSFNEAVIRAREDMTDTGLEFAMGRDRTRFGEYTEPGGDNYREFLIKYDDPKVQFDESHFDEENVIAHFRTKDRTTSDGKKVFYIEEIQSDWGQKGRQQGFKTSEKELREIANKRKQAHTKLDEYEKQVNDSGKDLAGDDLDEATGLQTYLQDTLDFVVNNDRKVFKAPFITDTDKWTQLTLKRILSKAVDEGYDFVSITPGKAQMDRWNDEGVAKFYDEIVPKNAEKIVKKLDKNAIQKDKEIDISHNLSGQYSNYPQQRFSIELTPQLKEKVKKGMAMFSATPLVVGQENE